MRKMLPVKFIPVKEDTHKIKCFLMVKPLRSWYPPPIDGSGSYSFLFLSSIFTFDEKQTFF